MMIVMKPTATEEEIQGVIDRIQSVGARAHPSRGDEVTVIGAIGDREHVARLELEGTPGVERVVPILKPYKLSSTQFKHGERTVLDIAGRKIGGQSFALIAGPCTVESREQTLETARVVLELDRGELVGLGDRDHAVDARGALEFEALDVLAVADRTDHHDLFAPAGMSTCADTLYSFDDGLDLLLGGRRFHHDHHQLVLSGAWERYESERNGFHPTGGFFGARLGGGAGPLRARASSEASRAPS